MSCGSLHFQAIARLQRASNAHPRGRASSDGVMPGICVKRRPRLLLLGTEPINPAV
jgi:hypothetical protein